MDTGSPAFVLTNKNSVGSNICTQLFDALFSLKTCEEEKYNTFSNDFFRISRKNVDKKNDQKLKNVVLVNYNTKIFSSPTDLPIEELSDLSMLKSLLFHVSAHHGPSLLTFSPPKSIEYNTFKAENENTADLMVEEFIDGTMINFFWCPADAGFCTDDGKWEIMTRKNIGADNYFYKDSKKTFGEMFEEAFKNTKLNFEMFSKNTCYSFVLCHPDNRIVLKTEEPRLYLVNAFEIHNLVTDGIATFTVLPVSKDALKNSESFRSCPNLFPKTMECFNSNLAAFSDMYTCVENMCSDSRKVGTIEMDNSQLIKGYVIRNLKTNARSKIFSKDYLTIKKLKMNINDDKYLYISLKQNWKVKTYLTHFPEKSEMFSSFFKTIQDYTRTLYQKYRECYIHRKKPLGMYPSNYRTNMYHLHEIFKTDKKPHGKFLDFPTVVNYVNNLDAPLLYKSVFTESREVRFNVPLEGTEGADSELVKTLDIQETGKIEGETDVETEAEIETSTHPVEENV